MPETNNIPTQSPTQFPAQSISARPDPAGQTSAAYSRWRSPRILFIAIIISLAGLGGFGLQYLTRSVESADEPVADNSTVTSRAVTTQVVAEQLVEQRLEATGSVIAADLLPILPRTTGLQIQQVLVDEGETVSAGQVLVILDSAVLKAEIQQQAAEVAIARAAVQQEEAAWERAQATRADAEANLERFRQLEADGAVSVQDLGTRETTFATADKDVSVATANIQRAKANVESQAARLKQLQIQLDKTTVRAPAAGLIAERFARIGDLAASNQPLFQLIRDRSLELEVNVPETQLALLSPGMAVDISSANRLNLKFQGRLNLIAPLVDPETRQAKLKINLPTLESLRAGMFLRASFVVAKRVGIMVPAEAIVPQPGGGNVVYRLNSENRAIAQPVELGEGLAGQATEQALVEIRAGLNPGDRIVTIGARTLNDRELVEVVNP
ncbi:MAG: efflux RND transporter periplasmic adaptor subunit [Cyanobacteria bacterium P01_G01_bin.54]